jgi:flagellar protein FlgJ
MTTINDKPTPAVASNIFDVNGLAALKRHAKSGDPAANKVVARQFEALFLQMVLKSMRDATPREGMFDSEQTRMYESLLDQQLGQALGGSGRGTGLAGMIEAQLSRQNREPVPFDGALPLNPSNPGYRLPQDKALPLPRDAAPTSFPLKNAPAGLPVTPGPRSDASGTMPGNAASPEAAAQRAFVERLLPAASAAERSTGIPAHFMVAQAALETGWGKSEPRRIDGSPSFNIFGIKAGASWRGPSFEAGTTEVVAGITQSRVERFRAYGSYDEAFRDYSSLLAGTPRYAAVLGAQGAAGFARGLQAAGYATDPLYAAKLERIIGGPALRQALNG